ncbi:mycothiol synthase [Janibacter cremeus]|uniref:Mycothiol acetyltransferase n=1 Tax=Janibacter cremeus TaxID=1285192 RepID=A0A852VLK4_9MICO|nr:mycothiol synthase [Janibacter cremeus]NYF97957.1 mycothiol synthase [Janibacter cremeus]
MTTAVTPFARLDPDLLTSVRAAAEEATSADGVAPLSEAFLLGLPREGEHLVATDEGGLAGYAQIADDGSVEAFVVPSARAKGVGTAVLAAVLKHRPDARPWAHGDLPGSRALAASLDLAPVRELLVLSRPVVDGDEVDPELPEGFAHRTFEPGRDDDALLAVNAAAFATHPEQGDLDTAGLTERMEQPWFEAEGLILLEGTADGSVAEHGLAGFHWTKVDPPDGDVGEVYVVGVRPDLHGRGLGGPLTGLGLAHLARRGVREVELYVEGDNHPALATYRRAGFERKAVHVMYSRGVHHTVE